MPGTSLDITQRPSPELPERGLRPSARYIRSRTSEHRAPPTHPLKPTRKHPVHQVRLQNNILNPQLKSGKITTRSNIINLIFLLSFQPEISPKYFKIIPKLNFHFNSIYYLISIFFYNFHIFKLISKIP